MLFYIAWYDLFLSLNRDSIVDRSNNEKSPLMIQERISELNIRGPELNKDIPIKEKPFKEGKFKGLYLMDFN